MYSSQESRIELAKQISLNSDLYAIDLPNSYRQEGDGWITTFTGHPFAILNDILLFHNRLEVVDESLAVLEERKVPAQIKVIGPAQSLIPRLIERGYEFKYTTPLMVWRPQDSINNFQLRKDLFIRRLEKHETELVWDVYQDVYGMPDQAKSAFTSMFLKNDKDFTYALYKNEDLVSLVTAMHDGDFVGIWGMGTPTKFQKNGYGAQLLSEVMRIHANLGARTFALYASPAGKPLYDKLKWITIEYIPHFGLVKKS
jgi:hypothetical protein